MAKQLNLDTLEFEEVKKVDAPPPTTEAKTETDPADKEDPATTPAAKEKEEEEVEVEEDPTKKDPSLLEEEEEEEEEEEQDLDPAAKTKEEEEEEDPDPIGVDEYIAEKYADYGVKNEEDLTGILDTYGQLQTDFEAIKKENEELKAASGKVAFASEQEEKVFNFLKQYDLNRLGEGMQTAGRLIGLDLETAEPRILLEEKFVQEHPELTRDESLKMFNRDWNRNYNLKLENFDGDEDVFKEEQELSRIKQKTEVAKAKEFLAARQKDLKAKPKEADAPKVEELPVVKNSITKNVQALDTFIPKFNSIVYAPTDNDQDDFTVNFSKDQIRMIHEATKGWISNPKSYDAKGELVDDGAFDPDTKIKQVAYLMYGDEIAAKIYAHAMNQADIKRAEQIAKVKPNREAKTAIAKVTGVSEEKQQEMLIRKKQAERSKKSQVYR